MKLNDIIKGIYLVSNPISIDHSWTTNNMYKSQSARTIEE